VKQLHAPDAADGSTPWNPAEGLKPACSWSSQGCVRRGTVLDLPLPRRFSAACGCPVNLCFRIRSSGVPNSPVPPPGQPSPQAATPWPLHPDGSRSLPLGRAATGRPDLAGIPSQRDFWRRQSPPPPKARVLLKPNPNFKRRADHLPTAASEQPQAFTASRISAESRGGVGTQDLEDPSGVFPRTMQHPYIWTTQHTDRNSYARKG